MPSRAGGTDIREGSGATHPSFRRGRARRHSAATRRSRRPRGSRCCPWNARQSTHRRNQPHTQRGKKHPNKNIRHEARRHGPRRGATPPPPRQPPSCHPTHPRPPAARRGGKGEEGGRRAASDRARKPPPPAQLPRRPPPPPGAGRGGSGGSPGWPPQREYTNICCDRSTFVSGIENVHGRVQVLGSSNVTRHSTMSAEPPG